MPRYVLRDWIFSQTGSGGLEIVVGAEAKPVLHMNQDELFEMMEVVGLGDSPDLEEIDDDEIERIEHDDHEY